jgi:transposase
MRIPRGYILITKEQYDSLLSRLTALEELVFQQANVIRELQGQLHKNSSNSHQPPSSDGLKRTIQNNRTKSEKKVGGQSGHTGATLPMVENPDKIIEHTVETCDHCGINLTAIEATGFERRQVYDIPPIKVEVTEHHIDKKRCPVCGKHTMAHCDLPASVQYGEAIKSMAVYLNQYQMLPLLRVSETLGDLFNCPISAEVILQSNGFAYEQLEQEVENGIKQRIINSLVMHNDETGVRCESKTKWIHTHSTSGYTYYAIDDKRGNEAMERIAILSSFQGTSVHDRWKSYDHYHNCQHGLCNAHLLRDLKAVKEEFGSPWAKQMLELTLNAYQLSKREKIDEQSITVIEQHYDKIVEEGLKQEPQPENIPGKRGRKAKTKSRNLLECYRDRKSSILLFLHNPNVPFDNNLAERDLRMVKLKQKISGCFRTRKGAEIFCRIRSYISTLKKQNEKVWENLKLLMSSSLLQTPVYLDGG